MNRANARRIRTRAEAVRRRPSRRPGFTLLETGLALTIVVVGVLAITEAQQSFYQTNSWSSHEATATYLASEVREMMRSLPRHDPVTGLSLAGGAVVGLGPESGETTIDDYDDIDDFDGVSFGSTGTFAGPVDAFRETIPDTDADGVVRIDVDGNPIPLQGWTQAIEVEKVNPFDFSKVLAWTATEAASGTYPGRAVDHYPVRVTVTVSYQGPFDSSPADVAVMSWIVSP